MKAIDEITIYNPAGLPYIADDGGTTFPLTDSCERTAKIMGEDSVRLVFNLKHKVTFDAFSFIEYNGQAFFLKERYVPKSVGGKEVSGTIQSARYAYDVKFVSVANMLDKFVCYRHVEVDGQSWNEPEININGTLETLYVIIMGAIEQAASRLNPAWFFTAILHKIAQNGLATVGGVVQPNTDNVRLTEGTQLLTFNFSGEKIANVCTTVANNFTNDDKKDTEWYITPVDMSTYEGATLHFAKCVKDDGTARVFRDYMVERDGEYLAGELKSVDYVQEWSGIPEVIVPYGSDRNMSYRSVKAIDEITQMQSTFGKRLRLQPNKTGINAYKFTDKDGKPVTIETDANGAIRNSLVTTGIEVVKFFDEIYPQCHFKVTSVSQKNKRQDGEIIPEYTVEAVPVDNDGNTINREDLTTNGFYPIKIEEATTLSVRFESGLLNGREFEIANKTSKDQGATTYSLKFTIVADGSIEDGTLIPSGNFIPRNDDTFALFNMKMPDEYVTYAELELAKRAYEELITLQSTRPEIKCESDETIFDEDIQFGDVLIVYSDRFDSDEPFRSRVISYSYKLSNPRAVTFNLASAIMQGTLSSMNDLIADVTHATGGLEQRAINLSRRGWRDASEVASMLDSLTADVVLVGNGRYQFGYAHEGQGVEVVHSTVGDETRTTAIKISHGTIEHTQEPYVDWVSKGFWEVSGETKTTAITEGGEKALTDIPDISLYLYAVVNESDTLLVTELTSIAHDADEDEGYLLMGILSSEFEGRRVFSRTNGYTSIEGGTITTEIIQDAGRNLIIDFQSNPPRIIARGKAEISGNINFKLTPQQISDIVASLPEIEDIGEIGGENLFRAEDWADWGFMPSYFAHKLRSDDLQAGKYVMTGKVYSLYGGCKVVARYSDDTTEDMFYNSYQSDLSASATEDNLITKGVGITLNLSFEMQKDGYVYIVPVGSIASENYRIALKEVMLQKGDRATAYQPWVNYLTKALQGQTSVAGGLLATSVILLRDGNEVTAGMSGVKDDNILLFGGGSYDEAVNAAASPTYDKGDGTPITSLIKKDGQGKIGIFQYNETQAIVDVEGQGRILIDASQTNGGIYLLNGHGQAKTILSTRSINSLSKHIIHDTYTTNMRSYVSATYDEDMEEFSTGMIAVNMVTHVVSCGLKFYISIGVDAAKMQDGETYKLAIFCHLDCMENVTYALGSEEYSFSKSDVKDGVVNIPIEFESATLDGSKSSRNIYMFFSLSENIYSSSKSASVHNFVAAIKTGNPEKDGICIGNDGILCMENDNMFKVQNTSTGQQIIAKGLKGVSSSQVIADSGEICSTDSQFTKEFADLLSLCAQYGAILAFGGVLPPGEYNGIKYETFADYVGIFLSKYKFLLTK